MAQLNAFNKDNVKDAAKDMARDIAGNTEHREGGVTKMIEKQTAKVPSVGFLGLAIGSMVAAIGLEALSRRRDMGTFVGLWVPTFLLFGIYNKIVKLEGSDQFDKKKAA
jgi:hypothetical protein